MTTKNLRNGIEGDDVRTLQDGLRKLGYQVEVDGKFGPRTEDAVKSLQGLFGYTVDGIAGEGTQSLIQHQLGYGWNLNLPNAKEIAMRAQGGDASYGKDGAQAQSPMQSKPMQSEAQGQPQQQGASFPGKPTQPGASFQGKPMQQAEPMQGKPTQGQSPTQGKPMQSPPSKNNVSPMKR